jgi:hypothetical protein
MSSAFLLTSIAPHAQRDVPRVDYKQKAPPKLPMKRAARAKRRIDIDEDALDAVVGGARKVARKDDHNADSLLKSFQLPLKQARPTSSAR